MSTEEQFKLATSELKSVQKQIDKYDTLLAQIKTWTITIWAGLVGWSFQSKNKTIVLVAMLVALIFWILDAVNKNFRQNYRKRRGEIALALKEYYKTEKLPKDFISPELPDHKSIETIGYLFVPHVFLLYVSLILLSISLYFQIK